MISNIDNTQFPLIVLFNVSFNVPAISLEEVQVDLIDVIGDAASSLSTGVLFLSQEISFVCIHLFICGQVKPPMSHRRQLLQIKTSAAPTLHILLSFVLVHYSAFPHTRADSSSCSPDSHPQFISLCFSGAPWKGEEVLSPFTRAQAR